jgi:hypothetical protein
MLRYGDVQHQLIRAVDVRVISLQVFGYRQESAAP